MLSEFYHQEFNGQTLAKLLEKRDSPSARAAAGLSVREWKKRVNKEISELTANLLDRKAYENAGVEYILKDIPDPTKQPPPPPQETDSEKRNSSKDYDKAVKAVIDSQSASTATVRKATGVGMGRAKEFLDRMEKEGIVGPSNGVTAREVLAKPVVPQPAATESPEPTPAPVVVQPAIEPVNQQPAPISQPVSDWREELGRAGRMTTEEAIAIERDLSRRLNAGPTYTPTETQKTQEEIDQDNAINSAIDAAKSEEKRIRDEKAEAKRQADQFQVEQLSREFKATAPEVTLKKAAAESGGNTPPANNPPTTAEAPRSRGSSIADTIQLIMQGVGAIDPTPITDVANAGLSLTRAFATDRPRMSTHLQNAATSGIGAIWPGIGDLAKLLPSAKSAFDGFRSERSAIRTDEAVSKAQAIQNLPTTSKPEDLNRAVLDPQPPPKPEAESGGEKVGMVSKIMDWIQLGGDALGVIDPSGIVDGANSAISVGRAFTDPDRKKHHLQNAAISAAGIVPLIGDAAKLAKLGRLGKGAKAAEEAGKVETKVSGYVDDAARQVRSQGVSFGSGGGGGSGPPEEPPIDDRGGSSEGPNSGTSDSKGRKAFLDLADAAAAVTFGLGALAAKGLHSFTRGLEESNRQIEEYRSLSNVSGAIAHTFARRDIAEIKLQQRRAGRISEEVDSLSSSQTKTEDAYGRVTEPVEELVLQLKAVRADMKARASDWLVNSTGLGDAITGSSEALKATAKAIADAYNKNKPDAMPEIRLPGVTDSTTSPWQDFFRDVSDGKFDGKAPYMGMGKGRAPGSYDVIPAAEREKLFGKRK